jgi:hypothetical protein
MHALCRDDEKELLSGTAAHRQGDHAFDPAGHTFGVRHVAVHTARQAKRAGLPVDVALVACTALSHDIGKFGCRGEDMPRIPYLHYYYTWKWLEERNMPDIAHIAANHSTWDLEFENLPIESLILIYADFRVRAERGADGKDITIVSPLTESRDRFFVKLADMTPESACAMRRYIRSGRFRAVFDEPRGQPEPKRGHDATGGTKGRGAAFAGRGHSRALQPRV